MPPNDRPPYLQPQYLYFWQKAYLAEKSRLNHYNIDTVAAEKAALNADLAVEQLRARERNSGHGG